MKPNPTTTIATTETQARSTPTLTTPKLESTFADTLLRDFDTFGDPALISSKRATAEFMAHLAALAPSEHPRGRWLSLLGNSGTGKTMLMERVRRFWEKSACWYPHPAVADLAQERDGIWLTWHRFVARMKSGERNISASVDDIANAAFVMIDDIGASRDTSGFVADLAHQILSARVGKPTMLTANLTLDAVTRIDARIASRLIRDDNVCLTIETMDYALRQRK